MRVFVIFLLFVGFGISLLLPAYGTIETTQFDLQVTSENFYETNPNRNYLVMKPGDSQQVTIQVTNNDSKPHAISLQISENTPRPERNFMFEPAQLEIDPSETKTSILTVSVSPNASTGTTIWHTFNAKSTTFGTKGFGFYLEVSDTISPPTLDPPRRGSPGSMFPSQTQFQIDESDAIKQIPYDILAPKVPEGYDFQGMYGLEIPETLIYSKQSVLPDTRELEFWDGGGLTISFFENDELPYEGYLDSLGENNQQVRINGNDAIVSESILLSDDPKTYSKSRVTVFLDNVKLRLSSQMPSEQIMKIAESMVKEKTHGEITDEDICGQGTTLQDGICVQEYTNTNSSNWTTSYPRIIQPPLKQSQSGIPFNEIQCNENLVLLQKYDGSPACVTESTKQKLIERGWTKTEPTLSKGNVFPLT